MGYGKLVRQNQLQKALLQLVLHAVIDYTRSDASFYSTKTWSRIGPWGSFVDLHWSISLAYTSNILLSWTLKLGMALPRCPPPPPRLRAWWQPYSDCGLQTSAGIHDWAKFLCTPILKFKLTNTICNNQDNSICIGNLYRPTVYR